MALSATKQAKIDARVTRTRREANIRAITGKRSLVNMRNPFMETNWDAQARTYLTTGKVQPGSFLDSRFREEQVTP